MRKKSDGKKIILSPEKRKEMVSAIQDYFLSERDEDLGDLAAGFFLDFVIEKLAPEFYNLGVNDSYRFMNEKTEDMLGLQKL